MVFPVVPLSMRASSSSTCKRAFFHRPRAVAGGGRPSSTVVRRPLRVVGLLQATTTTTPPLGRRLTTSSLPESSSSDRGNTTATTTTTAAAATTTATSRAGPDHTLLPTATTRNLALPPYDAASLPFAASAARPSALRTTSWSPSSFLTVSPNTSSSSSLWHIQPPAPLFGSHQHQHQHRQYYSVFVSKYASFDLSAKDILDYCDRVPGASSDGARTTSTHVVLRECPLCPKPTNNKADNLYKLYVQIGRGAYFCHRCGANGSWIDFKSHTGGSNAARPTGPYLHAATDGQGPSPQPLQATTPTPRGRGRPRSSGSSGSGGGVTSAGGVPPYASHWNGHGGGSGSGHAMSPAYVTPLPMPPQRLQALYSDRLLSQDPSDESTVLHYLIHKRGLEMRTLRKYGVGMAPYPFPNSSDGTWLQHECVTFSWIMSERDAQTQEDLRGATYVPPPLTTTPTATTSATPTVAPDETSSNAPPSSEFPAAPIPPNPTTPPPPPPPPSGERFITRRIKARSVSNKACQRLDPAGGAWGFFGYHTVPLDATEVILTEGEYDAMAVWQATGRPAISLPNGCRSLPVSALPLLERFEKVYLWMDNDGPGQEGAEIFAKKIGLERCYIVRPNAQNCPNLLVDSSSGEALPASSFPKDANDALLQKCDLSRILDTSKLTPHEGILSFDDLRDEVLHEILYPDKYVGRPLPSLPAFTGIVKGLRRGELWVVTGPTGSGKTTMLTQLSLDLAEQGAHVLWGSFEIKNSRLIRKMMQQYSRESLPVTDQNRLSGLADNFAQLPLHFLKFYGGTDVDDVLNAMEYAVYVNDCQHIILDNMQFMISRQNSNSTFDKFDVQDVAIEKFRKFATDRNVHITLVMHPRKQMDNSRLDLSSVYGSAKATQEADLVLILQDEGNRKFLDVRKNRFNGDLGTSPLFFDRKSGRYQEEPLINVPPPSQSQANEPSRGGGGGGGGSAPVSQARQYDKFNERDFVDYDEEVAAVAALEAAKPASTNTPVYPVVNIRKLPHFTVPSKAKATASAPTSAVHGTLLDSPLSRPR